MKNLKEIIKNDKVQLALFSSLAGFSTAGVIYSLSEGNKLAAVYSALGAGLNAFYAAKPYLNDIVKYFKNHGSKRREEENEK